MPDVFSNPFVVPSVPSDVSGTVTAPMPAEVKEDVDSKAAKDKEKAECLEQVAAILKEYDMLESNVPISSPYWGLLNKYRSL